MGSALTGCFSCPFTHVDMFLKSPFLQKQLPLWSILSTSKKMWSVFSLFLCSPIKFIAGDIFYNKDKLGHLPVIYFTLSKSKPAILKIDKRPKPSQKGFLWLWQHFINKTAITSLYLKMCPCQFMALVSSSSSSWRVVCVSLCFAVNQHPLSNKTTWHWK